MTISSIHMIQGLATLEKYTSDETERHYSRNLNVAKYPNHRCSIRQFKLQKRRKKSTGNEEETPPGTFPYYQYLEIMKIIEKRSDERTRLRSDASRALIGVWSS